MPTVNIAHRGIDWEVAYEVGSDTYRALCEECDGSVPMSDLASNFGELPR